MSRITRFRFDIHPDVTSIDDLYRPLSKHDMTSSDEDCMPCLNEELIHVCEDLLRKIRHRHYQIGTAPRWLVEDLDYIAEILVRMGDWREEETPTIGWEGDLGRYSNIIAECVCKLEGSCGRLDRGEFGISPTIRRIKQVIKGCILWRAYRLHEAMAYHKRRASPDDRALCLPLRGDEEGPFQYA